jgi:hypothetical protein
MADIERSIGHQATLVELRAAVARLKRGNAAVEPDGVHLCQQIDRALPASGLARAAFHEVLVADPGAAMGFCALVLARAAGPVVWIGAEPDIWPEGVHHLPDPDAGLRALHDVLKPNGALNVMVYAPYGRAGVYMLQDYCRRLGVGSGDAFPLRLGL